MTAQRPIILAALQDALIDSVISVDGNVVLPWDAQLDPREVGPIIQIQVLDGDVDNGEAIGQWLHRVPVRIGAVVAGAFDYAAAWEIVNDASAAIMADATLGGTAWRVEITGAADALEVAGEKILWPHLQATIYYLTPLGYL